MHSSYQHHKLITHPGLQKIGKAKAKCNNDFDTSEVHKGYTGGYDKGAEAALLGVKRVSNNIIISF